MNGISISGWLAGAPDFVAGGYPISWLFLAAFATSLRGTIVGRFAATRCRASPVAWWPPAALCGWLERVVDPFGSFGASLMGSTALLVAFMPNCRLPTGPMWWERSIPVGVERSRPSKAG